MSAVERKSKRRRKDSDRRKLLPGEKVEVSYVDEGLRGSWHKGVVINCGEGSRFVEFTDLLNDDGCSKLVESVPVSAIIEGITQAIPQKHHVQIRPEPPHYVLQVFDIMYGLCIDAFVNDAWWEGVVFDHKDGSAERLIFFPDQGDEQMISIDLLRLTQEWDEVSGIWKPRGKWLFLRVLESFEQVDALPVSIREIWYDLRTTAAFGDNIGLWPLGSESMWYTLVSDLVEELFSVVNGLPVGEVSNKLIDVPMPFVSSDIQVEDFSVEGTSHPVGVTHVGLSSISSKVEFTNRISSHEATEIEAVETSRPNICVSGDRSKSCWNDPNGSRGYFLQAVLAFISEYRSRINHRPSYSAERFDMTREMAKSQLLALGWDFKKNGCHKYYVSPGGKQYSSFIKACEACKEVQFQRTMNCFGSNNLICSSQGTSGAKDVHVNKKNKVGVGTDLTAGTPWLPLDLEATYCPEAIILCAQLENLKGHDVNSKTVRLSAKKHLLALGWKIESQKYTMLRIRFLSPEGKYYYSLHKVCCALLMAHQLAGHCRKNKKMGPGNRSKPFCHIPSCSTKKKNPQVDRSSNAFKLPVSSGDYMLKSISDCSCKRKKTRKRKAGRNLVGECQKPACNFTHRQLQSSKRSREVAVSSHTQQVARTVLSLLIDNDIVLPRQKVRYLRRRDGHVMMEGRVTRDGIRCTCCKKVYTLSNFEAHAGSTNHRPAANIFLQDGRSLMDCQMQMLRKKQLEDFRYVRDPGHVRLKSDCSQYESDAICSFCHDGGKLVLCDHCPSSFHFGCTGLQSVPKGKWFCPSCRCSICGMSEFNTNTKQFTEKTILYCDQCEREYHVGCLRERGPVTLKHCPPGNWFCSKNCSKIFSQLHKLLGKSRTTAKEHLSWTILRSSRENSVDGGQFDSETVAEHHAKLCVALDVLHECFVTIIEPRTRSDFVADIIFNKESELNRLNFWGFYTMLLEMGDELISVATFRVFGEKVAEMPLVGTRVKYRRQGMCRLLVNELEKLLSSLGVERMILPAVPQLLPTWTNSFGFTKMSNSDRSELLEYSLLNFQDTTMCQKSLRTLGGRRKLRGSYNQINNLEKLGSNMCSIVTEAVEMVQPIRTLPSLCIAAHSLSGKGETAEVISSGTNSEHCASMASCTNPNDQAVQTELNEQMSSKAAAGKCGDGSVLLEMPSIDVVKLPTGLNSKFWDKCYKRIDKRVNKKEQLGKIVTRDIDEFKYFYKRRIPAN